MIQELTSKECTNTVVDIMYIDFNYDNISEIENSLSALDNTYSDILAPTIHTKSIHMGIASVDTDLELQTATFLLDNIKENSIFPQLSISDILVDNNKKLIMRINQISYYIANEGRIGLANTLVMNHNMFQYDFSDLREMNIVFNEYVPDDVFYIIRNNNMDQPGYKFVYRQNDNNELYYAFTSLGFFPEKQAVKLVLV